MGGEGKTYDDQGLAAPAELPVESAETDRTSAVDGDKRTYSKVICSLCKAWMDQ